MKHKLLTPKSKEEVTDIASGLSFSQKQNMVLDIIYSNGSIGIVKAIVLSGFTPQLPHLEECIRYQQYSILKFFLETGSDPNMGHGTLLINACRKGLLKIVQLLLAKGADPDINYGEAVMTASLKGHYKVVSALIKKGVSVDTLDESLMKAIAASSDTQTKETVNVLLDAGADVHVQDDYSLRRAVMENAYDIVEILLKAGANVHVNNEFPLTYAVMHMHKDMVKLLVDHGADPVQADKVLKYHNIKLHKNYLEEYLKVNESVLKPKSKDEIVSSISHLSELELNKHLIDACRQGLLDYVNVLLDEGADVNANDGESLMAASSNGYLEIVKVLVKHKANIHAQGDYALRTAAHGGYIDIVKFLESKGANINARSEYAIRYASEDGHTEVVKFLISKGADVNVFGGVPLELACRKGHTEVVKELVKAGSTINEKAFSNSCEQGHVEIVKILINAGSNINPMDSWPIRLASGNGHTEVVKILLKAGAKADDTALKYAAYYAHKEIVKLLLKAGANYESAIEYAKHNGYEHAEKLLVNVKQLNDVV